MPNSTPEQLQDIRNRLRNSGTNQSAQIGMVLNELVDLMTEAAPRMRQVAESLSQENRTPEEEVWPIHQLVKNSTVT
jgi:cytolysin (calcineurin-like family phosphatase)